METIDRIVELLVAERAKVNNAIAILTDVAVARAEVAPPEHQADPSSHHRRRRDGPFNAATRKWTPAQRKAQSERARAVWASKSKAEQRRIIQKRLAGRKA